MSMSKNSKKVLCVRTDKLPDDWKNQDKVVTMSFAQMTRHLTDAGYDFIPRAEAEKDSAWKQVIPSAVVHTKTLTAVYQRRGREERLRDLWSVGIGGHVDYADTRDVYSVQGGLLLTRTIINGLERELDEELIKRPAAEMPIFRGIINHDKDVSRYHLGLLFEIRALDYKGYVPGPELKNFIFSETDKMPESLDSWSIAALEYMQQ
jgi:predicted NUDIX family phosphoesterase